MTSVRSEMGHPYSPGVLSAPGTEDRGAVPIREEGCRLAKERGTEKGRVWGGEEGERRAEAAVVRAAASGARGDRCL